MKTNKKDIVLDFIRQFRSLGSENCFSSGMCFWFATILQDRFWWSNPQIMYDDIENHFACNIDGRIYDINGDVTDNAQYHWQYWQSYQYHDPKHTDRIRRNCIDKLPGDVEVCGYCPLSFFDDQGNLICNTDNSPHDPDDICNRR